MESPLNTETVVSCVETHLLTSLFVPVILFTFSGSHFVAVVKPSALQLKFTGIIR